MLVFTGLHYKNHILWNKGNIQNSARYIVHYSIEKDNKTPTLITCGSHAPNEICVFSIAGLVINSPHQHVWKGSLLNWSYSCCQIILCLIHLHYTKLNNYLFLCAQSMQFLPMSHVCHSFSQHLTGSFIKTTDRTEHSLT